ncbi:MAG TPA: porin, partial [Chitinophagaceae bacterium]
MKQIFFIITAFAIFSSIAVMAQEGEVSPDSLRLSFKPYGSFRGHFAFYNKDVEFQENGSRIGFEFSVKRKNTRFFVASELQINMFKGNSTFSADANLSGGFLVAEKTQQQQVFGTRLGYLGVDLDKFGTISVGKQWSVYYDITSYTDKFDVFGGQASATFVAGTDGGGIGTGRADQVLIYRNQFGPVYVGAQMQARTASNNEFIDGYGFSAQLKLLNGLKVGAAFNKGFLNKDIIDSHEVLGLTNQPGYVTVGASYISDNLELGAVYAHQTNGDLAQGYIDDPVQGILTPTVVFDANGLELYGKYKFGKMTVLAGYNNYNPDAEDITTPTGQKPLSPDFKKNYVILGLEYRPVNRAYFYAEQRFSNGKTALGANEFDVATIGIRIDI